MQTLVNYSGVFTEVPIISCFPLILVGAPRKGQAPDQVTPEVATDPSPRTCGSLRWPFLDRFPPSSLSSFRPNHHVGLVPFGTSWRPQHKYGWCGLQDYKPLQYTTIVRTSTMWARGVQTLLNTMPKPMQAPIWFISRLSTLQSTIANHLMKSLSTLWLEQLEMSSPKPSLRSYSFQMDRWWVYIAQTFETSH